LAAMQVFYVNIGGGEPLVRRDFFDLLEHAVASGVGVKFSTNGALLTRAMAARLAATDYVDVQVSLDGASRSTNHAVRGGGRAAMGARRRAPDYVDAQVSRDGASRSTNDAVRGEGSYAAARRAMDHLAEV